MKKLMVLGGSKTQIPLLESASAQGYYIVLCDFSENNPGMAYANKFYQVSTVDREAVLEIAKNEKIDGIVSNSERAMIVVAYVSEQLGLIGNSVESIEKLNSKYLFREVQREAGVFCPQFSLVSSEDQILEVCKKISLPFIIKPCQSSGTRGTTQFTSYDEQTILQAFQECSKYSRNHLVAVEEFVEKDGLTVLEGDVFVLEGEYLWNGLFFTNRSPHAPMVPMTYCLPLVVSDEQFKTIKDTLSSIFSVAGIRHGEYNVEMYFSKKNELFVIEINARQGGFNIPEIIKRNSNIDMSRLLTSTAVGDLSYFEEVKNSEIRSVFNSECVVFSHEDGVYDHLCISPEIEPYVVSQKMIRAKGDKVRACQNTEDAIGFVELVFDDFESQHKFCDQIEQYIYPVLQ